MPKPSSLSEPRRGPDYRTVWRWHFYAGLICIPFVLWLSVTGSIYLFKPQIEGWLDRPYDNLHITGPASLPAQQVRAALSAAPGSVLNAYELPTSPTSATRVLVGTEDKLLRVYVHPQTLQVLKVVNEDERLMRQIFHLHGELMQGDRGSIIVETAASWVIVMLITGLFLWWPRGATVLAGVLYPRLTRGSRMFWRDLHAVTGLWVSFFALFLLVSGLPWAKSWGSMLKELRKTGQSAVVTQDWTTGRDAELAERRLQNASDEHAQHAEHGEHASAMSRSSLRPEDYDALNRLVPLVQAAHLAPPVLIAPPSKASTNWSARSDSQNRPQRATLRLDPNTSAVLSRENFSDRPLMDRVVGVGVAAHEGQLFAPLNQLLGLFTALGLSTLSVSAIMLWWRRRPEGVLGAPPAIPRPSLTWGILIIIAALAVLLPLLGATMIFILLVERFILRQVPATRRFLGL